MAPKTAAKLTLNTRLYSAPPSKPPSCPLPSLPPPKKPVTQPPSPAPTPTSASTPTLLLMPSKQARVLVGPEKCEFIVDRDLLAAASPTFREGLEASARSGKSDKHNTTPCIWLTNEAPAMFELFVVWLHHRSSFRRVVDAAIDATGLPHQIITLGGNSPDADTHRAQKLHWGLVRLHLFAARLSLLQLQDASMDALQDLYLARDWDVTSRIVRFLYGGVVGCSDAGMRIRRWIVAMVAWQLAGGSDGSHQESPPSSPLSPSSSSASLTGLLARYPQFRAEYDVHLCKMTSSGLDVRVKNPQLRIPANRLRSEERMFAFRHCSFHSHRAAVGERECPHMGGRPASSRVAGARMSAIGGAPKLSSVPMPLVVLEEQADYPTLDKISQPRRGDAREHGAVLSMSLNDAAWV